uniref:Carrier protein n=1 Tax=Hydatigena taeniaeformis TaxID=6205 RepID=A0A0R3WY49_HYDTA
LLHCHTLGITASTLTNPIWYVKTRLQLDSRPCSSFVTAASVIRTTWREYGMRGFYRGISASYVGSIETALNFVLYENIKGALLSWGRRTRLTKTVRDDYGVCGGKNSSDADRQQFRGTQGGSKLNANSDMLLCMGASAFSKAIAITAAYPHGAKLIFLLRIHIEALPSNLQPNAINVSIRKFFCSPYLHLLHLFMF